MNAREFFTVEYALNAVREWAHRADQDAFPRSLGKAVASLVAIRRDPGLFRAIDVCVDLVELSLLAEEDIQNVLDGLDELLLETDYQHWRRGDIRTATLTYVRANAYRLARVLRQHGKDHPAIEAWIAAGSTDPAPEVRYVADNHQ
jgi:glutathione S-transferase